MDLDAYLSQTIEIITKIRQNIDEFTLNSDLKQYILNESEEVSKTKQLDINSAVSEVLNSLGTPEEFANKILSEINEEKKYLLLKVIIASVLAFFPIIILVLVIFRLL